MSELKDKVITCNTCGKEFVHSVRDQEFFAKKKFANEPKACPDCRRKKKAEIEKRNNNFKNNNN